MAKRKGAEVVKERFLEIPFKCFNNGIIDFTAIKYGRK